MNTKKETPARQRQGSKDSQCTKIIGGETARQVFKKGGLRDRLRNKGAK